MANIGENIKKFRKERGLTQKELSKLSGVHEITIANYESGKYSNPKKDNIQKIADALNVNIGNLDENCFLISAWDHSEIHKSSVTLTDLGYECFSDDDYTRGYVMHDHLFIVFDKYVKQVRHFICVHDEFNHEHAKPYSMTVEEVTAINNEMEILGWHERKFTP